MEQITMQIFGIIMMVILSIVFILVITNRSSNEKVKEGYENTLYNILNKIKLFNN